MSVRKILIFVAILLLLPFALRVQGQDFGRGQSLFSDIKAHNVGDIVTILIEEQNRASSQVESKTEKSSDVNTSGGPGVGPILGRIPLFGVSASDDAKFDGKGENLRQGTIQAKITCTVIDKKPNGDLVIEGTRVLGISGDRETITITGVVRERDVTSENTVLSHLIADAEIHYTGKGNASTAARPGFFTRLFNWLF
ncbi:MAG: flagellar basal body L-ring protein FlgH [candidate division Zixibacteria bacterium]|jgi:flagellar L-ring protein precursor FlgH|nr:flagellar basal body L-ring protein FlgH [candidate division Zixibacteria bacterium]